MSEDVCKACSNKVKKEDNLSGGITIVRQEVKKAIQKILKEGHNKSEVVNLLKADAELKVTDPEIAEVADFMDLVPEPQTQPTNKSVDVISKEEFEVVKNELTTLRKQNHRSEIRKFVEDECPNLNIAVNDAVENILKAEEAGEVVAKALKDSYKSTSDALKNNAIFKEYGRAGDTNTVSDDNIGNGLVSDVRKGVTEIAKADSKLKKHEVVLEAIRKSSGQDGSRYMGYREEHRRRAKLA